MSNNATFADVCSAAIRLNGVAHRTPVFTSILINHQTGAEIYFKCENFQRTGSFKFRGAFNALSQFDESQRQNGVVAFSSGNHAEGIALAANLLGIPATIVMPADAPSTKAEATRQYGAQIVTFDRKTEQRERIAASIARQTNATLIPSYDHPHIIAGQGTAAKELFEEVPSLDVVVTPLGGGGLLSGTLLVAFATEPSCDSYGVEPLASNDGQRSLAAGSIVHIEPPTTIADGASTQHLGELTFAIIKDNVTAILTVTDDQLVDAMKLIYTRLNLVAEPTGCLGLAGVMQNRALFENKRVGIVITGGNVGLDMLSVLGKPQSA